jgi:DNA polymerase-1
VFLVTKDKDLMQLVGPRVRMLAPDGFGVFLNIGPEEVLDKMGVPPEKILDYLSLVGDASDNIPGVPGIGSKTAAKILESAGVDEILDNPSLVEPQKFSSKITAYKEQLRLSKMLATLRFDIDLDVGPEELKRGEIDRPRSIELLKEFEFFSLIRNPIFGSVVKFEPATRTVRSIGELRELVNKIKENGEVSIDILADGPVPRAAVLSGITLAIDTAEAFYIPLDCPDSNGHIKNDILGVLSEVIESERISKIGHDLKFGLQVLRREGITLRGIVFDTLLAAYVADPGKRRNDLHDLTREWLNLEIKRDVKNTIDNDNALDLSVADDKNLHAAETACAALLLRDKLKPALDEMNCASLLTDMELALLPVLADLEWHGILIDTDMLSTLSAQYTREMEVIVREIYEAAGGEFNLNSPKQVGEILFDKLGLHGGKKTKSGNMSTNVEVLEKLADDSPIVQKILDYREKQKLLSTYIDALPAQILPETGRIHTSFNQAVTATGRLSSANPNLQNIPIRTESGRKIREAFIAPAGSLLVAADYSQIELRILAHLSNDPVLVQAFADDMDIHTQTASAVYGIFPEMVTPDMRRAAKTINFGLMYGMGPLNLSKQLNVSFAEAKRFIDSYFNQFPAIQNYMDEAINNARTLGYSETLLGRKRSLPEVNSSNRNVREAAERTAINTPVQGTAADIIKLAMIRVNSGLSNWQGTRMLLQVHDELVFETPEKDAESFSQWVKDEMSAAYQLKVPLKVDAGIGKHWGEAH